jgi:hypothetical protein
MAAQRIRRRGMRGGTAQKPVGLQKVVGWYTTDPGIPAMRLLHRLATPPAEHRPLGGPLQHMVPGMADAAAAIEVAVARGLSELRQTVRTHPVPALLLLFGAGILLSAAAMPRHRR